MEDQFYEPKRGLIPNYFRKIGLGLIIGVVLSMVGLKLIQPAIYANSKEALKLFGMNTILLGLLLIAWARDKVEDEMTIAIRFKAMGMSMICGVLMLLICPVVQLLFKDPVTGLSGQELVFTMLSFNLFMYFVQKRGR